MSMVFRTMLDAAASEWVGTPVNLLHVLLRHADRVSVMPGLPSRVTISPNVPGSSALPFDESAAPPPPAFGPYRVLHQIGSGVLGPVFRTYDPQRDRLVAVKAVRFDLVPDQVVRLAEAFRRLVATPPPHAVIVPAIDGGLEDITAYLAMEYVTAETLDVALRHLAPAPLATVLPIVRPLAEAIDAAWAATPSLTHGALHPRDIFLSPGTNDVRMTGWGMVAALEAIGVRAPIRRPYTAPERNAGDAWDIRADIFSLGAITHELLTGRRPAGPGEQDGALPAATPAQRVQIRRVLSAALAEHPSHRFSSAIAFVDALDAVTRGETLMLDFGASEPDAVEESSAIAPIDAADVELEATDTHSEAPASYASTQDELIAIAESTDAMAVVSATESAIATEAAIDRADAEAERQFAERGSISHAEAGATAPIGEGRNNAPIDTFIADRDLLRVDRAQEFQPATMPAMSLPRPAIESVGGANMSTQPVPYPWFAIAVVCVASLVVGGVGGYQIGARRPPIVSTAAASAPPSTPSSPATDAGIPSSTTEVQVTPPTTPASSAAPAAKPGSTAAGHLLIHSDPTGAIVTIDGKAHGKTPATIRDLPLGAHIISIEHAGFETETRTVSLTATDPSRELTVALRTAHATKSAASTTGPIDVDSRPRGARVFVDGKFVGVTPLRVSDVAFGAHAVRIELSGYKTLSTSVRLGVTEPGKVSVSLEPNHGESRK